MYHVVESKITEIGRFSIEMDTVEKGGRLSPFSFVRVRPGITVIPFVGKSRVLILKEYRHPIQSWQYEFPSGMIDAGETPQQAAVRELSEETGLQAGPITPLGCTYPSFGSTNEVIHLFAAECTGQATAAPHRELLETMETEIVDIPTLEQMIRDGRFAHASGIVAWWKWKNR